jgi:putative transposase
MFENLWFSIHVLEIDYERDYVHFLVQGVPKMILSKIVGSVKSITTKEIFRCHPLVKEHLWVAGFWTIVIYAITVSQYGIQEVI